MPADSSSTASRSPFSHRRRRENTLFFVGADSISARYMESDFNNPAGACPALRVEKYGKRTAGGATPPLQVSFLSGCGRILKSAPTMGIPFVRAKRCEVIACGNSCPPCEIYGKPSAIPCRFYQSCANFIKILSFGTRRTPVGSVTDFVVPSPVLSNFGNNLQILPGNFVAFFEWKPLHFMEIYGILLVSKLNRRINGGK